jgi:hypothetical protein
MPKSPQSHHTSDLGVTEVRRICNQAAQIFREVTVRDVGIDAFIEVVDNGAPTGDLIGVQIKTGDSYLSKDRKRFLLPADAGHFAYWARCSFPVIGVIHVPRKRKTYWTNVTAKCNRQSILRGPYVISANCGANTELNPKTLQVRVIPEVLSMQWERLTIAETNALLRARTADAHAETEVARELNKDEVWQQLVETIASFSATDDDVANAAYRLAWYLWTVSADQKALLRKELAGCSQTHLAKLLRAVHLLMLNNNDAAAEIAASLVRYIPRYEKRIESLLKEQFLPADAIEAAIQVVEVIGEESGLRNDLRKKYSGGNKAG